ncbi:immune inhibitor A, partial [bacterium]|nr:immune inhibitor A [bacterium]
PDCPGFYEVVFDLDIVGDWGYATTTQITVLTSGGDFSDDVEGGEGAWTHGNITGGFVDQWHIDTYRSHTTSHSWKFGGTGSAVYANSADGALYTQELCIGTDGEMTMWHWMAAEEESSVSAWDCGLVQITDDGGVTWSILVPTGGYSHQKNDNPDNPLPDDTPCWSGSIAWTEETFDLTAFEGETVQIRFRFVSDGYVTEEGWYLDDIEITSAGTGTGIDDIIVPVLFALKQNAPNPFNPTTIIHYQLPQSADVKVEIYNVAGKLVRTLVDEAQDAGFRSVVWDGTSDTGRAVASGVYMYRLQAGDEVAQKRMVLLK